MKSASDLYLASLPRRASTSGGGLRRSLRLLRGFKASPLGANAEIDVAQCRKKIAFVKGLPSKEVQAINLPVLARYLPDDERNATLLDALAAVRDSRFRDDEMRFIPLILMATDLTEAVLPEALALARTISDKETRAWAAAALVAARFVPNDKSEEWTTAMLMGCEPKDARKTDSKAPVENYEKPSYNPPDMDQSPDIGGAAWKQRLHRLINNEEYEAVEEECTRYASARAGAPNLGMAAHGREVASVPEAPIKAKKPVARPPSRVKHSFIEVSRQTNLRHRHSALVEHYEGRTAWEDWKGEADPTPDDFNKWLDSWASDRRRVGLLYSDLRYLDWSAYVKLKNWKKPDSGVSKKVIASFGLPTKIKKPRPKRVVRSKRSSPVGQSVAL
jgi:hypothetical protein